ncbi:MAG: PEP-CTERM sorting domain-containing protein [Akkermansia muciniphila]|nr:PEP-CTERM sorting domain-containing protein [Akkermansia muciniphila]
MKLHLPKGLLAVLLSCFVSTAAFTYGTTITLNTGATQSSVPTFDEGDTTLVVDVTGTGVTWGAGAQVGSDVTATVNIAENASMSVGTTDAQYSVFAKKGGQTINVGKNAILTTTCSLAGWQDNSPNSMTTAINLGEGATWNSESTMGTDKCEYLHRTIVTMNGAKINVASGSSIRSERGGNGANKFVTRADAAAKSTIQGDGSLITQNSDITFDVAARTNKTDATEADLVVSTTLSKTAYNETFIKAGTGVLNVTKGGSVHLKVQNGVLNLGAGATLGTLTTESGVSNVSGTVTTVNTSGGETNVSGTVTTVNASGGVTNLNANGTIDLIDIRGSQGAFNGTVNIAGTVAASHIWITDIASKENAKLNIVGSGQLTYDSVSWSSIDGTKSATLTNNGATGGDAKFSAERALYTIADAAVTYEGSANKTFALKLQDSSLVHNGTGTVTLNNAGNTIVDISGTGSVVMDGGVVSGTLNVSSFDGSDTAEITGSITGGAVQNVNILSTQSHLGSTILSENINFDVQNGKFDYNGEGTYSTATGIQTVTRDTILISGVDATRFTAAFKVNGEAADNLTIDADGIRGSVTTNTTTYLIANKTDVVSWSDVKSAGGSLVKFTAGGKLTTADTDKILSSDIEVATGVVGSRLSGSGTYVLSINSTDIKVDALTDWTGTVELSGSHTGLDLSSAKLGNVGSTILLDNVTADNMADATVNANVKLTYGGTDSQKADGLTITGNKANITFNGNVTGVLTGNRTEINILNQVSGTKLNFTGTENTGVQIIDEKGSSISFSGNATDISTSIVSQKDASTGKTSVSFDNVSDVSMRGNILNDKWSDWHAKGDLSVNLNKNTKVTFSGSVHANTLNVASGAEASFAKDAKLDAMIGSGTLKASGGATTSVEDASGFTGTLMTTDGSLLIKKASSLAAIDSASSGGIWLMDSASSVTVDEIVLSGSNVGVSYIPSDDTSTSAESTVSTGSLTVRGTSTSTLYANLELKANGTLKLDSALAMGSTLTLGSGITLSGSLLDSWMDRSNALTLFSGVDGLTVNGVSVAAGETNGVKASDVFGDSWSNYSLVMTGGTNNKDYNVQLVQTSDVPEPTTATLSLLALMGLAARRRRKAAK